MPFWSNNEIICVVLGCSSPKFRECSINQCVQRRLVWSAGVSPVRAKVRSPVAKAVPRETKVLKPTDKAISGMVSESPGRSASESGGSLDKNKIQRPSLLVKGEDSIRRKALTWTSSYFGGVIATAWWQGQIEQLEKALLAPGRNALRKISPITSITGKWRGSERVTERCVRAGKRSNARGAKAPYLENIF